MGLCKRIKSQDDEFFEFYGRSDSAISKGRKMKRFARKNHNTQQPVRKSLRFEDLECRELKTADLDFTTPGESSEGIKFECFPPGHSGANNEDEYENGYCDIILTVDDDSSNSNDSRVISSVAIDYFAALDMLNTAVDEGTSRQTQQDKTGTNADRGAGSELTPWERFLLLTTEPDEMGDALITPGRLDEMQMNFVGDALKLTTDGECHVCDVEPFVGQIHIPSFYFPN